jgi:hypothetical protein
MHHAKENSADTGKPVIRHSTLPKLAACPKYLPKPGPVGPAAERGTRMDAAIRRALEGDRSLLEGLTPEDKGPAEWAVALFQDYKRNGELETREEYLAMHTPGISHVGTADVGQTLLGKDLHHIRRLLRARHQRVSRIGLTRATAAAQIGGDAAARSFATKTLGRANTAGLVMGLALMASEASAAELSGDSQLAKDILTNGLTEFLTIDAGW